MMSTEALKNRSRLRILLLQIRDEQLTRVEELASFASYSGLQVHQFEVLNLFDRPRFEPDEAEGYDAVYVGGSSEASVLEPETYPFVPSAQALLRHCIARRQPVFASCFGHQLAVQALGGVVLHDDKDFEMGTLPISLTPAAARDPLFTDTPNPFMAVSVHREKALEVPPGCELLAYTNACVHSFRVRGAPFWTTQFHPEVDRQVLVDRLSLFRKRYTRGDDHLGQVLKAAVETPESNGLLHKFVDRVLLA